MNVVMIDDNELNFIQHIYIVPVVSDLSLGMVYE